MNKTHAVFGWLAAFLASTAQYWVPAALAPVLAHNTWLQPVIATVGASIAAVSPSPLAPAAPAAPSSAAGPSVQVTQ